VLYKKTALVNEGMNFYHAEAQSRREKEITKKPSVKIMKAIAGLAFLFGTFLS
jgi:hypothetical protein